MRNSLFGGLTVVLAASGPATASVWTITGASIAGSPQSVSSIRSGAIDISGGIQDALDDTFVFGPSPVVPSNSLSFFGFQDLAGTEYFGFFWDSASSKTLQLTASASGATGLQTNTTFGSSPSGETFTSVLGASYYYLFSGVGPGSTISISGLVPNLEIQWLDWDGSAWQLLGSGSRTGVSPGGDQSFALGSATAVPGGAVAGLVGVGLAGRLVGRRRERFVFSRG